MQKKGLFERGVSSVRPADLKACGCVASAECGRHLAVNYVWLCFFKSEACSSGPTVGTG